MGAEPVEPRQEDGGRVRGELSRPWPPRLRSRSAQLCGGARPCPRGEAVSSDHPEQPRASRDGVSQRRRVLTFVGPPIIP